jgi:putative thioredoxin
LLNRCAFASVFAATARQRRKYATGQRDPGQTRLRRRAKWGSVRPRNRIPPGSHGRDALTILSGLDAAANIAVWRTISRSDGMDLGGLKPAGASPARDLIKDGSTASFAKDVIEASRQALVLVDFWAAWCGPCKQLTPIIEKVVASYGGKVRLVKIDTDAHPAIAGQLRIQSLPTVYAFRDGRPLDGFMGAQPESAVRQFIDRLLGDDAEADLAAVVEAAEAALEAGDLQSAAEAFAAVLQEDQQNVQAIAGLARCYLKSGDVPRAEQTLSLVPPDKQTSAPVQSARAALELAKMAGKSDNSAELEQKLAANPADHQARFDLAVALAARGKKEQALEHLLDLVRRDRNWNEQAARKQLVQLFDAWGPKDERTLDGRRRLSSILFS